MQLGINGIAKMQQYWYLVVEYDYSIVVLLNSTDNSIDNEAEGYTN